MNNDRFKFRVWDRIDKRFYSYNQKPRIFEDIFSALEDDLREVGAHFYRYVLLQCTGLKDSEGQLIYEGDVVKWRRYDRETNSLEDMVSEVYWEEKSLLWGLRTERIDELGCYAGYKIVGNIYENPELDEKDF